MKKGIIVLFLLLAVTSLFAQSIDWFGVDEGIQKAQKTGKNIFLLITAPDWCGWCIRLEEGVLSRSDIINKINKDYIPVRILDTDAEIDRYDFSGFPTVRVLDKDENFIADIYTQNKGDMMSYLNEYTTEAVSIDSDNQDICPIVPILLPEELPVFTQGTGVVNHSVRGYTQKILPVINHYKGKDGGYVAIYKNGSKGAVYAVSNQIYVMGMIRVQGCYHNRIFIPAGYFDGDDITQDPRIMKIINSYYPEYSGDMWIGGDTGGFFGIQENGKVHFNNKNIPLGKWLKKVKKMADKEGYFMLNPDYKCQYIF